jgi:uncharacterized cupredoxin-like copper-binding protein
MSRAKRPGRVAALVAALTLGAGIAACGDDDEDSSGTEESASAETVTVTTGDTADGFSWEVEPTPTAETKTVEYVNESEEPHAMVFARINEGYTLEEAYELQGEKGSADVVVESGRKDSPGPGETVTYEITDPIEPGNFAMLCPIPGHYQQGQLEEFEIQ